VNSVSSRDLNPIMPEFTKLVPVTSGGDPAATSRLRHQSGEKGLSGGGNYCPVPNTLAVSQQVAANRPHVAQMT
jgi:hypothetical protein